MLGSLENTDAVGCYSARKSSCEDIWRSSFRVPSVENEPHLEMPVSGLYIRGQNVSKMVKFIARCAD